jgi:hypothetical protein
LHELGDAEIVWANPVNRANRSPQHVIQTPKLSGALYRNNVFGFFDNTDQRLVSSRVSTHSAQIFFTDIAALAAEPNPFAHRDEEFCQPLHIK